MIEKVRISNGQTILLVIIVIVGGNLLFLPSFFVGDAQQDGWIANIIGVCIGLLFVFLYASFARRFPNMTFAEFSEKILGKFFGKLVAFIFYLYLFLLISTGIREIGDFVNIQMLPLTPLLVINLLFVTVIVIGARLGLETFTRAIEVFFPFMIILFIILSVFTLPIVKLENFLPMFEEGIKPIVGSAIHFQGFTYLQLIVFLMIFPSIEGEGKLKRSLMIGGLIGGLVLIIITTLSIGGLGAENVGRQLFPSYVLARTIHVSDFLTRIEVILAGIWFLTLYFKTTFFFYALSLGIAQSLKLNDYRMLTLPLGMIALVYSIAIAPNTAYLRDEELLWNWVNFGITIGLVLPLIMLGVAKLRKL